MIKKRKKKPKQWNKQAEMWRTPGNKHWKNEQKNNKNYETSKKLRCNELSGYSLPNKKTKENQWNKQYPNVKKAAKTMKQTIRNIKQTTKRTIQNTENNDKNNKNMKNMIKIEM